MSRDLSVLFVRSLPAELRTDMVREWQESLRTLHETIATLEAALEGDLADSGDPTIAIENRPDFDGLLKDLHELASLRARRDLFVELLALAEGQSAVDSRD